MKTIIPFYALFFLFIFASCKKEKYDTVYVPNYLKLMLPYSNGQVIRYSTTYGNIIETTVSAKSGLIKKSACPTCDPYVQEEFFEFKFNVGTKTFVIISVDIRPNIFMTIFSPQDDYQIGGGFDFLTVEDESKPICNGPRQICLSTIILNGKTYTNVLEIISGASSDDQLTKAYYTVNKGLIGFAYGNGTTFVLVE